MKKKIIITGGFGFIGTKLIEKIKKQYNIYIIDNSLKKKVHQNIKNIKCDLTNSQNLKKIKITNADVIIHLAGQSSGPKSYNIPETDLKLNLMSTINVINFAKINKIKKIIFSSTFTVYGNNKKEKLAET